MTTPAGELRRPCAWCQKPTPVQVLIHLGARCQRCFDAWCAAPQPAPPAARHERARPRPPDVELPPPADVPMPAAIPIPPPSLPMPISSGTEEQYAALPPGAPP